MNWTAAGVFYDSMGSLLSAGMPIPEAICIAGKSCGGLPQHYAERWQKICSAGGSFSGALQQSGAPALDVALIGIGEKSGHVPDMCRTIAGYYRLFIHTRNTVLMRLQYPVFVLHLALVVWQVPSVAPKVLDGSLVALLWLLVGPMCLWIFIGVTWCVTRGVSPITRTRWLMRIPMTGMCYEAWFVINTAITLRAALGSGMLVPKALEFAAGSCGNAVIAERVRVASAATLNGQMTLSAALASAAFPALFVHHIEVGERAGKLDDTLDRLVIEWQENLERRIALAAQTATAIVYGTALVVAAFVIISFWAGYFNELMGMANEV